MARREKILDFVARRVLRLAPADVARNDPDLPGQARTTDGGRSSRGLDPQASTFSHPGGMYVDSEQHHGEGVPTTAAFAPNGQGQREIIAPLETAPQAEQSIQQSGVFATNSGTVADIAGGSARISRELFDSGNPKLTVRTDTFGSTRTIEVPDSGQARLRLTPIKSAPMRSGLDPVSHSPTRELHRRPSASRSPSPLSEVQGSFEETPLLEEIFPLKISAVCQFRFSAPAETQRSLDADSLDAVSISSEKESWGYDTSKLELPKQDIDWYRPEAYKALLHRPHMRKCLEKHPNVDDSNIYIRYGCCRVVGPPDLPLDRKYARIKDDAELAQKAIHAICGFIHEHQFKRFHLVVFWDYSFLVVPPPSVDESFAKELKAELQNRMVTNINQKQYIPKCDLNRFERKDVIQAILCWGGHDTKALLSRVILHASRMLLMCIWNRETVRTFLHLLEAHALDDQRMLEMLDLNHPPSKTLVTADCSKASCAGTIRALHECAPRFLPLKIGENPGYQQLRNDIIVPLHYYDDEKPTIAADEVVPCSNHQLQEEQQRLKDQREEARLVGTGVASKVFKVWIEPSLHDLSGDLEQNYALKRSSTDKPTQFEAERRLLEKLYEYPHPHITPHYGSWQQNDYNYVLLPLASCNLRHYLQEEPRKVNTRTVKWFFRQLSGLADAIRHVHHIRRPGTKMTPVQADENYAYHHDIKPENILVFEKVANSAPILRIADFGAGSLYDATTNKISSPPEHRLGTLSYFAPEWKDRTRPFDMWSLGCCFLEMVLWLFQRPGMGANVQEFTQDRKQYPGYDPHDTEDRFWYRQDDGTVHIKPAVLTRISWLRHKSCKGMEVFQTLLNAIRAENGADSLLTIDKHTRMKAEKLVSCLDNMRKQIDLQERTDDEHDNEDPYAQHFRRNMGISDNPVGDLLLPMGLRSTLTATDASSARDIPVDEEPSDLGPSQSPPGPRSQSASDLVAAAGHGALGQDQTNGVDTLLGSGQSAVPQTPELLQGGLQGELDSMQISSV